MSILDSWSERVGDALEQAKNDLFLHSKACARCERHDMCDEGIRLAEALQKAEQDFSDFINCDEV